MSDLEGVTRLLEAWSSGHQEALDSLMEGLQKELRRIAANQLRRERPGHTLQPTALVNELYLRLVTQRDASFESRQQFFALASRIMRRILVDHARERRARKRHGIRVTLKEEAAIGEGPGVDVLALDLALTRFAEGYPRESRVVELRYFGGLTNEEIADLLSVSARTVKRDWRFARRWLHAEIGADGPGS